MHIPPVRRFNSKGTVRSSLETLRFGRGRAIGQRSRQKKKTSSRETLSRASRRELPASANRLLLHTASRPLRLRDGVPSVVEEATELRAASTHSSFSLYSMHTPCVRGIDRQSPAMAGVATVNSAANRMGVIMSAPFRLGLVGPKASDY